MKKTSLTGDSFLNLLGILIPLVTALPLIGFLARNLSLELFGFYTIILGFFGYAGLFDAGLAKSVTKSISSVTSDYVMASRDELEKIQGFSSTALNFSWLWSMFICFFFLIFFLDDIMRL